MINAIAGALIGVAALVFGFVPFSLGWFSFVVSGILIYYLITE